MGFNSSETTIGAGYLESYAEIPAVRVEDPYLAAKKLGGHLRLFDPLDVEGQLKWFTENLPALETAYGQEAIKSFIDKIAAR